MSVPTLEDRLLASHRSSRGKYALKIWARFVETVVLAVDTAGVRLGDPERVRRYSSLQGWWRRARRPNSGGAMVSLPAEDAITDALVTELETMRNEAGRGDPLFDMNIVFAGQQPRRTQTRIGLDALTTDIRAHVPGQRGLDMRIEAKVLFNRSDLSREFLGTRGLLRFADQNDPYADTPVGAMLGYVVAPFCDDWSEAIEAELLGVGEAVLVERVAVGTMRLPVCDLLHSAGQGRVTVLHISQIHRTLPCSWPATPS